MMLDNPFIFQSKLSAQEIFVIRKANEMEYHEARMANLAELHSAQMEVVALEKEYFRKRIALLNSMYTLFCKFYGKIGRCLTVCYMRQLLSYLGGHLFPNYNMYAKYFDPNNFLPSNYYCNYQNYRLENCNLSKNFITNKQ